MTVSLLIDCDPGIDDMVGLLVAAASPEVTVLGVTTVAGNVDLEVGTRNALDVLALAGRAEVPVAAGAARPLVRGRDAGHRGAHAQNGLGGVRLPRSPAQPVAESAVEFLRHAIGAAPVGSVTLVALGPLTNVALLYAAFPAVAARLARVVVMGGSIGVGNVTPAAEFNVYSDPEAAYRVLGDDVVPTTLVGLDVTLRTVLEPQDVEWLRSRGPVGARVAAALDGYAHGARVGGVPMHDAVAVAEAIRPGLVVAVPAAVEVDCTLGPSRGNTVVSRLPEGVSAPCRVAVDADPGAVVRFILERVGRHDPAG